MRAVERVVCLLATHRVAAEGVSPDKILGILHAELLRSVVKHAEIGIRKSRPTLHRISHLPPLELHVLEVIRTLVAVLVLHPRDGALACLGIFGDDGCDGRLHVFALLASSRVVGPHLSTNILGQRHHSRKAVVLLELRGIPQDVRLAVDVHSANAQSSVAVILILDERAHSLRPLHVVQSILQLPRLQPSVLEVGVAVVLHGPGLLAERLLVNGVHKDIERVTGRTGINGH